MGQTMSSYKGTFNTNFENAVTYNSEAGGNSYDTNTSTSTQFAKNMNIPGMIQNKDSDDVITYLMILQATPMNKILNKNLTNYGFNIAKTSLTQIKKDTLIANLTASNINTQKELEDNMGNVSNAWAINKDGRILYKLGSSTSSKDVQNGCRIFKCLVNWFNALDNIQNQYLSYLTNTPNPTQSYINSLILQADSVSRKYSGEFNSLMQGEVAGVYLPEFGENVVTIKIGKSLRQADEDATKMTMQLKLDYAGTITEAYFNNGTSITIPKQSNNYSYTANNASLKSLDHYAYSLANAQLRLYKAAKLNETTNLNKIFKFYYKGTVSIIAYSPSIMSQGANVYHIVPLTTFLQLVQDSDKANSEGYRCIERFNSKIGKAMSGLDDSATGTLMNTPRMQQFRKNIAENKINLKHIKAEGFTPIYK